MSTHNPRAGDLARFFSFAEAPFTDRNRHDAQSELRRMIQSKIGEGMDGRQAFFAASRSVAACYSGSAPQAADSYEALIACIPESERGVRDALRKVSLTTGIQKAPGWK